MIEIQIDLDSAGLDRHVSVTLYFFVSGDRLAAFDRGVPLHFCPDISRYGGRLLLSGPPSRADAAFELLVAVLRSVNNCGSEDDPGNCGTEEDENQRCNLAKQWNASGEFVFTDCRAGSVPREGSLEGREGSLEGKDLRMCGCSSGVRSDTCVLFPTHGK